MSSATSSADLVGSIFASLQQIAEPIAQLRDHSSRVSEEDTKRILITPTIKALGWNTLDFDEVRNEYRHRSSDNPVDYALFVNRSPVLFVEAKPLEHSLEDRRWVIQAINYANAAGVDWCVLTNGANWRVYKVHAQGEVDRKLFESVSIEHRDGLAVAAKVLALLTRDNMGARAIDELWAARHVDSQVKSAIDQALQDDGIAKLLSKRLPQLGLADIRQSLQRARVSANYPNVFGDKPLLPESAQASAVPSAVPQATGTAPTAVIAAPSPADSGVRAARRRMQSTQDLVDLGRLKVGTVLTIRGRQDSAAKVLDCRCVEFKGERLTFNEWGQRATGWSAIQIYAWALLPDGRSLGDLRDQRPIDE